MDEVERYSPEAFTMDPGVPTQETAPKVLAQHYDDAPPRGAMIVYKARQKGRYLITPGFFEHLPVTFNNLPLWEMTPQRWNPGDRIFAVCSIKWDVNQFMAPEEQEEGSLNVPWYYRTGGRRPVSASILVLPSFGDPPESFGFNDVPTTDASIFTRPHVSIFPLARIEPDGEVDVLSEFFTGGTGNYFAMGDSLPFLIVRRETYPAP